MKAKKAYRKIIRLAASQKVLETPIYKSRLNIVFLDGCPILKIVIVRNETKIEQIGKKINETHGGDSF